MGEKLCLAGRVTCTTVLKPRMAKLCGLCVVYAGIQIVGFMPYKKLKRKYYGQKIDGYLKLQVPAGNASPSPPIGPALGQRGLNIMEFCKAFNAKTQEMEKA